MSFGKDLQDFVQAFGAGYNMIGQSQKDKAAIEESKSRANLQNVQAAAIPTHQRFEEGQIAQMQKRGDFYESHANLYDAQAAAAGRKNPDFTDSTISAIDGTADSNTGGAAPPMSGPPPSDPSMNPANASAPDTSPIQGFDDNSSSSGAAAPDASAASDQSNYAPSSGAIPDYRTAAPTAPTPSAAAPQPPQHLAQLFPAVDQRYNLPPGYSQTVSAIETGHTYNPAIVNPQSQATGLFQFMPTTAKKLGIDPANPASAAHGFGQLTNANQQLLSKSLGRPPSPAELYLAHQQGPTAAALMLNNPNVPAIDALTRTYQLAGSQNPRAMAQQALVGNGGSIDMTSGAFATKWMNQFNRENARITGGQQAPQGGSAQVAEAAIPANPGAPASDAYKPNTGDSQVNSNLSDLNSYLNPPAKSAGGDSALGAVTAVGNNAAGKPVPLASVQGATKAGLQAISDNLLPQGQGAVPTSSTNPAMAAQQLLSGTGAASHTVVQALNKVLLKNDPTYKGIDPNKDFSQFYAHAAAFIMSSTTLRPQERANAIGELLQYGQNGFNQYAAIAKAAVQAGNMDDAVKASVKAYMHIPDGQSVTAAKQDDTGKYMITFKDDKTGAVTSQQLMSPDEMGAQIMKTTPALFQEAVARIASVGLPAPNPKTITAAGRAAMESVDDSGYNAQIGSGLITAGDVGAYKIALEQQAKNQDTPDNAKTRTQMFVQAFTGGPDGPGALQNPDFLKGVGGNAVAVYNKAIAHNMSDIKSGVNQTLIHNKNIGDDTLGSLALNVLAVDPRNPDAPPEFQVEHGGAAGTSKVIWNGGDAVVKNSMINALMSTRQDIVHGFRLNIAQSKYATGAVPGPNDTGGPDVRTGKPPAAQNGATQAAANFGGETPAIPSTMMETPKPMSPDDYIAPTHF